MTEELAEVVQRLRNCENDFNEVANKSYTVKLGKNHGHYELTLDKIESRITRLNVQKEELVEKARVIEEVWQKQHLEQAQVKIFGSKNRVQAKNIIIFFLIMFVITILAIDLLGIGATGGGAGTRCCRTSGSAGRAQPCRHSSRRTGIQHFQIPDVFRLFRRRGL